MVAPSNKICVFISLDAGSPPCTWRYLAVERWPRAIAQSSGEIGSFFDERATRFTSAPRSSNSLHKSALSVAAAMCNGVLPSWLVAFTWEGRPSSSHLTNSRRPEATASWRGRSPFEFLNQRLAPFAPVYEIRIVYKVVTLYVHSFLKYFYRLAIFGWSLQYNVNWMLCIVVLPSMRTVSSCPLAAAVCAGLRPRLSCRCASAPCCSSVAVASAWPSAAA